MKPLTAKEVEEHLKMHGYIYRRTVGSHFMWVHPETGVTIPVPHHGNRALKQGTLGAIFAKAGIPKPLR